MTTPIFSIPELAAGVKSPEVVENEKTRREEVYIARKVLARNQNAPAGGEAEGSAYIVGSTPTGSFAGFTAGNLAALIGGSWYELSVPTDYRNPVWSVADGSYYARISGVWTAQPAGLVDSVNGASGTVVLTADDIGIGATYEVPTIADLTKLDGIEAGADVTDETNVVSALSGATLTDVGTPASTDKVLLLDASDGDNLKRANFSEFAGSVDINGLTENAVYESASDTLVYYDVSAGANRKIRFQDLPGAAGGDQWSDPVDADIVPGADSTYDLGSSANRFALAFVDDLTITTDIDLGNDLNMTGSMTIDGDIVLNEKADHTETPAAGKVALWAKNTTPATLIITDDTGADVTVGGGTLYVDLVDADVSTLTFPYEVAIDHSLYERIEINADRYSDGAADNSINIHWSEDNGSTYPTGGVWIWNGGARTAQDSIPLTVNTSTGVTYGEVVIRLGDAASSGIPSTFKTASGHFGASASYYGVIEGQSGQIDKIKIDGAGSSPTGRLRIRAFKRSI